MLTYVGWGDTLRQPKERQRLCVGARDMLNRGVVLCACHSTRYKTTDYNTQAANSRHTSAKKPERFGSCCFNWFQPTKVSRSAPAHKRLEARNYLA